MQKSMWAFIPASFAVFLSACAPADTALSSPTPPNVIVLLVDDLGWRDVGYMGSDFYETPHIDALARRGTRFTQAYASHPVCSPSRAAFMTGKDPARLQITDWIPGFTKAESPLLKGPAIRDELALEEVTLAEVFKAANYKTLFTGKWHLGETEAYWPEHQGFDVNIGGIDRGAPPAGYFSPYNNPRLKDGPKGEFLTQRLGAETVGFIEENADRPFMVYHAFYSVHTPIQADPKRIEYFREKAKKQGENFELLPIDLYDGTSRSIQNDPEYASMIGAVDDVVGDIMATLERLNIADNTIIVFASDNGGLSTGAGENKPRPTSNIPLKAGKGWLYEGGIRTPLLIASPSRFETVDQSDAIIRSVDIMPTLIGLAGIENHDALQMDGLDFSAHLRGESPPAQGAQIWYFPHYHAAGWKPGFAVRSGKWKLIGHFETQTYELYDLESDPNEMRDIAQEHQVQIDAMLDMFEAWRIETGAILPTKLES